MGKKTRNTDTVNAEQATQSIGPDYDAKSSQHIQLNVVDVDGASENNMNSNTLLTADNVKSTKTFLGSVKEIRFVENQ